MFCIQSSQLYKLALTSELGSFKMFWFVCGVAISLMGWYSRVDALVSALWLLPVIWLLVPNRLSAACLFLGYFSSTLVEVPTVTQRFMGWPYWQCLALYVAYVCLSASVWFVLWSKHLRTRIMLLAVILVATAIPPLGLAVAASPLLSSGALFPSFGMKGLALTYLSFVFGAMSYVEIKSRIRAKDKAAAQLTHFKYSIGLLTLSMLALAANLQVHLKVNKDAFSIKVVNTHFDRYPHDKTAHYARQSELASKALDQLGGQNEIVVLPESIGGSWSKNNQWIWQSIGKQYRLHEKTLIVGFDVANPAGGFDNSALVFGQGGLEDGMPRIVSARLNLPVGGWRPWDQSTSQNLHLLHDGLLNVDKRWISIMFCWEEWTLWPWLVSAWQAQEITTVISLSNHWFAQDLKLPNMQEKSSNAWARLMGWALHRATNYPEKMIDQVNFFN